MAKRALDPHRSDAAVGIREGGDADDRVQFEKGEGRRWIVEINLPCGELFLQSLRQRVCVNLEADRSAVFGETPGPTPPFFSPAMALCNWSASPQKASLPNVSKRNVFLPSSSIVCALRAMSASKPVLVGGAAKANTAPIEPAPSAAIIVAPNFHAMPPFLNSSVLLTTPFPNLFRSRPSQIAACEFPTGLRSRPRRRIHWHWSLGSLFGNLPVYSVQIDFRMTLSEGRHDGENKRAYL